MGIPTAADLGLTTGGAAKKIKGYAGWSKTAVAKILKNETYAGTWHFGKTNGDAENVIAVQVPAIVDADTFARAQARRALNAQDARRNAKHPYLIGRRVTCGACGATARGITTTSAGRPQKWSYYICNAAHAPLSYARSCDQRSRFPAGSVDAAVWGWVRSYLADPVKLAKEMDAFQTERDCAHEYQHSIFDRNRAFITGDMRCEEGYFYLPDGPGLGVEPREAVFDYVMGA